MNFIEILERDREEKADGKEHIRAKNLMPERVQRAIPFCIVDIYGNWDYEVLSILAWIRSQRDKPDMTRDKVEKAINTNNAREIALEVGYYFSPFSREEIADFYQAVEMSGVIKRIEERKAMAANADAEPEAVNPPESAEGESQNPTN